MIPQCIGKRVYQLHNVAICDQHYLCPQNNDRTLIFGSLCIGVCDACSCTVDLKRTVHSLLLCHKCITNIENCTQCAHSAVRYGLHCSQLHRSDTISQCAIPHCTNTADKQHCGVDICYMHILKPKDYDRTIDIGQFTVGGCQLCPNTFDLHRTYNGHLRCPNCITLGDSPAPPEVLQLRRKMQDLAYNIEMNAILRDLQAQLA